MDEIKQLRKELDELKQKRVYQQDIVPNIALRKPTLHGSTHAINYPLDQDNIIIDINGSNLHFITLLGNRTLFVKNASIGQPFILRLTQDDTGSRTVTWFDGITWVGGTPPTLTTTASKTDVFVFVCTDTDLYDGFIVGMNL